MQGALTGIPDLMATHLLFADDLSLMFNDHMDVQIMLNKLRILCQMIFCQFALTAPCQLPYTDTFKCLGLMFDKAFNLNVAADAALGPFTAGTFRVR